MSGAVVTTSRAGNVLDRGKRLFQRPAAFETQVKSNRMDAKNSCPLRDCLCDAVEGDKPARPPVIILNLFRSPSHIARFVIAIVVDSVKRMFRRWALSYIIKKRRKGLPAFTNRDASSAVVVVKPALRISTPASHSDPCPVFRRWLIGGMPVLCFATFTATGFNLACPESVPANHNQSTAGAATFPHGERSARHADASRLSDNRQLAVSLSGFVFDVLVPWNNILFSHDSFLSEGRVVVRAGQTFARLAGSRHYTRS